MGGGARLQRHDGVLPPAAFSPATPYCFDTQLAATMGCQQVQVQGWAHTCSTSTSSQRDSRETMKRMETPDRYRGGSGESASLRYLNQLFRREFLLSEFFAALHMNIYTRAGCPEQEVLACAPLPFM